MERLYLICLGALLVTSFTDARVARGTVRCYTGQKMSGAISQGNLALTPCPAGACSTVTGNLRMSASGRSMTVGMIVGQCVSPDVCTGVTCQNIKNFLPSNLPATFDNCDASCCYEDRCNDPDGGGNRDVVNPSVPPTTTSVPASTALIAFPNFNGGTVRCYTGQKMSGAISQGNLELTACPAGACSTVTADLHMSTSGRSITVGMVVGQCVSPDVCAGVTCQNIKNLLPSNLPANFDNCDASCCYEDRCNDPNGSGNRDVVNPSVPPTTTSIPASTVFPNSNGGTVRCYTGQKMSGAISRGNLELTPCPAGACSTVTADLSMSMGGRSMTVGMIVGQCVSPDVCSGVTCQNIESMLPSGLPTTFDNCDTSCCSEDKCNDPDGSGNRDVVNPSVPPTTTSVSASTIAFPNACQIPMWNLKLGTNWLLLKKIKKSKPRFQLIVKKVKKGTFKPKKIYKILVRVLRQKKRKNVLINGLFITLESAEANGTCPCGEAGCALGSLIGSRLRRAGEPTVQPGCDQPLMMEFPPGGSTKKMKAKWRAPACSGPIKMRVAVRGDDRKLYMDDDDALPKYQALTKVLRPK